MFSLKILETLTVVAGRDGGVENMEVVGTMTLRITDPEFSRICISVDNQETRNTQLHVSPIY